MALTKQHTVEFSKNKHTPSRTTPQWTVQGNLFRIHSLPRDVNSRGPHSTVPFSQATTRGFRWPVTYGVLSRLSWLPCGATEGYGAPSVAVNVTDSDLSTPLGGPGTLSSTLRTSWSSRIDPGHSSPNPPHTSSGLDIQQFARRCTASTPCPIMANKRTPPKWAGA